MKKIIYLLCCLVFVGLEIQAQCGCDYDPCGAACDDIMVDGLMREYILHVPDSYDPSTPTPLVFNFHGLGSDGAQEQAYASMNAVADEEGFIVVYPYGMMANFGGCQRFWNAGILEYQDVLDCNVDDAAFTVAMIDYLATEYNIDQSRVYSCGMSMGGFMSYYLACVLEDRIAAIASVTGVMNDSVAFHCQSSRSVPVLQMHGTADATVPYNGAPNNPLNPPVEEVVQFWADKNCCTNEPIVEEMPDLDPDDGCTATRFTYTDCDSNNEVILYRINGGGHTWPGALFNISITNYDINGSQVIWDFFEQYTLESGAGGCESCEVGATCDDENDATYDDVINENCECEGVLYDCSDLNLNLGDTCDDGDDNTENDVVNENCECIGEVVFDCAGLGLNIGDTCDDGDDNTAQDLVNADCECEGVSTSLEDVADRLFKASPNPFENVLLLEWNQMEVEKIQIHNIAGKLVKQQLVNNGNTQITLSLEDLKQGVYFVQLVGAKGSLTKKVVKQ